MIIDMHCHAYPRSSAEAVNTRLAQHGLAVPQIPVFDADEYVRALDLAGIDMAVLSLPGPLPDSLPTAAERLRFARAVNDLYAAAMARHPGRFRAFGRVPLVDRDAGPQELRRIITELGMSGVTLPTNVLDRYLDEPEFDPFWQEADRFRAVCFFAPAQLLVQPGAPGLRPAHAHRLAGRHVARGGSPCPFGASRPLSQRDAADLAPRRNDPDLPRTYVMGYRVTEMRAQS